MSGALTEIDNSQQDRRPRAQPSIDSLVLPAEAVTGHDEAAEPRASTPQRRRSFFVVSNRRRKPDSDGLIAPPETINIRPAQSVSSFEIPTSKKRKKKRRRESSLDAILRHEVNGPTVDNHEARIPLPESRPSSSASLYIPAPAESFREDPGKSSLEIIIENGISPALSGPQPSSIPLPESRSPSLERTTDVGPRDLPADQSHLPVCSPQAPSLPLYEYEQMILRASEFMTHLKDGHINAITRHDNFNVSYIDFSNTSTFPGLIHLSNVHDELVALKTLGNIRNDVQQRLIVVEDLSKRTIRCLGKRFGVPPEFFEEHLINSGYEGMHYNDRPAHTWSTYGMKKSYISMKWHRPVFRLPIVPFSQNDLRELLDPAIKRLEYTSNASRHMSIYQTETNIFRSEWGLWTDPRVTPRMKRVCGWEERASIWSRKLPDSDCQIGTFLSRLSSSLANIQK